MNNRNIIRIGGIAPLILIGVVVSFFIVVSGGGYAYNTHQKNQGVEMGDKEAILRSQNEKIALLEEKLSQLAIFQDSPITPTTTSIAADQHAVVQEQIEELKKQNSALKNEITKTVVASPPLEAVSPPSIPTLKNSGALTIGGIIAKVKPSVVSVDTRRGSGSGFVVGGTFVVTNAHVVDSVYRTQIGFSDGQIITGYVSGRDEVNDIAIITIPRTNVTPLAFGSSMENALRQGDEVYAFGFPFGLTGEVSFTEGSISRRVTQGGGSYLEISNSIHPGNSGGPLVNKSGDIIGINTLVYGYGVSGVTVGETIKFAIPSDRIKNEISRLTSAVQALSESGKGQIDLFEDFMTKLNAIDSDIDAVAGYREYYAKAQNTSALTQLIASSTVVKDRAAALAGAIPSIYFQNTLKAMAENRRDRAQTLVSIYETEIALIRGRAGNNVTTAVEASLAKLDKKMIELNSLYEVSAEQLHDILKTHNFY